MRTRASRPLGRRARQLCLLGFLLVGASAVLAEEPAAATPPPAATPPAAATPPPVAAAPAAPEASFDPLEDDLLDPSKDPDPELGLGGAMTTFFRTLLMLGLVIGLAYLTLHKGVGKLVAKSQQGKSIKVVERIGIEQRRALLLIEVEGKRLLVGSSEGGMNVLADLSGERASGGGAGAAEASSLAEGRAAEGKGALRSFAGALQSRPRGPLPVSEPYTPPREAEKEPA